MKHNGKFWRSRAWKALSGHWIYAIVGMVVVKGINMLGSILAAELFPGTETFSMVLSEIFLFVFTVVAMIFSTGYNYMLLNMARGKECGFADLLSIFHRGTDGVLVAGSVVALIQTIVAIPFYYMAYFADPGDTLEMQLIWMETCLAYMLVSIALSVLFTLPFAATFYLLADDPQMKGLEALEKSVKLMKGKMVKYLLLQISFLPWMFLALFTMGIGLLWVFPYMQMANTQFYRDLIGELQ